MSNPSQFSLSGRVAIVSGGSTGIGQGIAVELARAGADVAVAARTVEALEATCEEIRRFGQQALPVPTDVTQSEQVRRLAQTVRRELGRIDILVNNAGGTGGTTGRFAFKPAPFLQLTEEDFDGCIALNLKSVFLCSKAVAPMMLEQGKGVIVNISTCTAQEYWPPEVGTTLYGAAKAGVDAFTRLLAVELAPKVRVNCIVPGVIDTPRVTAGRPPERIEALLRTVAMGRAGLPADIASAVVYLASDAAGWITGARLDVHGGVKSSMPLPSGVKPVGQES